MTTVSSTFTAVGKSSTIAIRPGEKLAYVLSGTFVGTLLLQRAVGGGKAWETVNRFTSTVDTFLLASKDGDVFRWKCSAYTSGTVTYSLADVATNVIEEWRDRDGTLRMRVAQDGITGASSGTASNGSFDSLAINDSDDSHQITFVPGNESAARNLAIPVLGGTKTMALIDLAQTFTAAQAFASLLTLTGVEDTLTAHAGGSQAAALALSATKMLHRVSICATNADSVILPAATVGQFHFIRNDGAAICQVYGALLETINDVASATGVAVGAGKSLLVFCITIGKWSGLLSA